MRGNGVLTHRHTLSVSHTGQAIYKHHTHTYIVTMIIHYNDIDWHNEKPATTPKGFYLEVITLYLHLCTSFLWCSSDSKMGGVLLWKWKERTVNAWKKVLLSQIIVSNNKLHLSLCWSSRTSGWARLYQICSSSLYILFILCQHSDTAPWGAVEQQVCVWVWGRGGGGLWDVYEI